MPDKLLNMSHDDFHHDKELYILIIIVVTIWYARLMEGAHTWPALNVLLIDVFAVSGSSGECVSINSVLEPLRCLM